ASAGMKHLISAVNVAYDEPETRGFFKLRGLALLLTLGAVVFLAAAFGVVALLPSLLEGADLADAARTVISFLRWPGLAVGFGLAMCVVYRYAPNRDDPKWSWTSVGAV